MNKRLLGACIFFSLFLHVLALFLLQNHSVWFSASAHALTGRSLPKSAMLKESFLFLSKGETASKSQPQRIIITEKLSRPPVSKAEIDTADLIVFQKSASHHGLIASNDSVPTLPPPPLAPIELALSHFIIPTRAAPPIPDPRHTKPHQHPELPVAINHLIPPKSESPKSTLITYRSGELDVRSLADLSSPRKALLTIPSPPLPAFPTLDELETASYSDSFEIDLVCASTPDHSGYLFALTLIPRSDLQLPKLHQHYHFLIDRANSIQRERLLATKSAVMKAIEDLAPDDTFNIIVFDSKIEKLFSNTRPPDAASIAGARAFLDQINLGSFFAPADLYNPLALTLPQEIQDDELHTAILMTDGENLAKKTGVRALLQNWTWQNNGRVALFTVAMGNDPHLATLDAASVFNKGRLYYSPTKRGIKRKLLKLMQCIREPIAKDVACRAIGSTQKNQIQIYPRLTQTPHLYLDQPFVMIGTCDTMDDFILFVQGRLKDRWMNIKKNISFLNAKKGGDALMQQWALQQAYQCYERYVRDDNPEHLAQARELLAPYNIQVAFQ